MSKHNRAKFITFVKAIGPFICDKIRKMPPNHGIKCKSALTRNWFAWSETAKQRLYLCRATSESSYWRLIRSSGELQLRLCMYRKCFRLLKRYTILPIAKPAAIRSNPQLSPSFCKYIVVRTFFAAKCEGLEVFNDIHVPFPLQNKNCISCLLPNESSLTYSSREMNERYCKKW